MSTVITAETIVAIAKTLADKVAISLATKSIIGGVGKIRKKSPEERVAKALERALNQVAVDNEFWKNDVKRQVEDVILILIHTLDDPRYIDHNPLPHYLDEEIIESFKDCLKKDPEAWDYIQKVHFEKILQEIRVLEQDTNNVSHDTNERVRRIEEDLKPRNATVHFLTGNPSKADSSNVIGRDEDLDKLWKMLSEKHHILLTGFGGIGKTKLAQMLFHKYESRFDEVAWIEYQGNLKRSFLGGITAKNLQFEGNEDERWNAMKSILNNDGKKKLFIIDNVDHIEDQNPEQDTELHQLTGWSDTSVVLTSRISSLENYSLFSLDFLDNEDSIRVFNYYYPGKKTLDQTIVADLVELADRHTLTVELLAKGAWQYNIKDYYEMVKEGFNKVDDTIQTTYRERKEDTIEGHLRFLFSMKDRSELEKQILNSFAILPIKCRCTKEELENWFGFKKNDWNTVLKDGWLNYDEESRTYFMHPLVRTIVRFDFTEDAEQKKSIAPIGTADKILDYFYHHKELFDISQGYISLQRMTGIIESAMSSVTEVDNQHFATLYNNIGGSNHEMGNYAKALECFLKALTILKKIYGAYHPFTAKSYNNIGSTYIKIGDFEKALEYSQQALILLKTSFGNKNPLTAATYSNIGIAYEEKGQYDMALKYLFKDLEILKKTSGTSHRDIASSYNCIGMVYNKKGDYQKALKYLLTAMLIREKHLDPNHADTATSYDSVGLLYCNLGEYKKALNYCSKALEIRKKFFLLTTQTPLRRLTTLVMCI